MGLGGFAKICVREVYVDAAVVDTVSVPCVVCPVKQIEELKPELESDSLRNPRVLVEVDIRFDEIGPTELLRFLVSFLPESWNCEVALRDCTGKPGSVVV